MQKKVVILGDSGVGKTSILFRYLYDKFEDSSMPTMGASFKSKLISLPNKEGDVKLNLWDTAGQEKFKSLTRMYYQDAEAAVIVYDTTYRPSFDSAKRWIQDLKDNANQQGILIAIVGNKSDLNDKLEVSLEEAHELQKSEGAQIILETSAKDNTGVTELFEEIAIKLYRKQKAIDEEEQAQQNKNQKGKGTTLNNKNGKPNSNGSRNRDGGACQRCIIM